MFAVLSVAGTLGMSASPVPAPRNVPAQNIPAPRFASDVIRQQIEANDASKPGKSQPPFSLARLKKTVVVVDADESKAVDTLLKRFPAVIEPRRIAGVSTYLVTPSTLDPALQRRLLVHVHGGAYAFFGGRAALTEAILAAHYTHTTVLSIDYRRTPDHPYPAALDDTLAVWRALLRDHDPHAMAIFGTSAGGGLAIAAIQHMRANGLPTPAALFAGTPWDDLIRDDDSQFTNAFLDDFLGDGTSLAPLARLYAGTRPLSDPGISPINGDFHNFPPTILITGTRDLLLSMTVRTHRKLRDAGAVADLDVFEGLSHADFLNSDAPESATAFRDVATFFNRYVSR